MNSIDFYSIHPTQNRSRKTVLRFIIYPAIVLFMKVDARDVLDPNAKTIKAFKAQIVGHFKRVGPNPWDDYRFKHELGKTIDVLPKLRVQIEKEGYDIRIRRKGKVFRVRWIPSEEERKKIGSATPSHVREFFVTEFLELFQHTQGLGGAAVIAQTLRKN